MKSHPWLLLGLLLGGLSPLLPAQSPPSPPTTTRFDLPPTDEGLPGAGPIRRYDWFQNLWREHRSAWAESVAEDRHAVVFLGDSITDGWEDLATAFPGMKVANRGISGDTSRGVLIRLEEDVLALDPRAVVLLIGTNDIEEQAELETIAANVDKIIEACAAHNPQMPVILCEVFPSSAEKRRPAAKIKRLNELYREAVQDNPQVTLLETWALFADGQGDARPEEFPDLLHPNAAGYAKWAAALRPVLATLGLLPGSSAGPAPGPDGSRANAVD